MRLGQYLLLGRLALPDQLVRRALPAQPDLQGKLVLPVLPVPQDQLDLQDKLAQLVLRVRLGLQVRQALLVRLVRRGRQERLV
jgi:hypothetical protein